MIKWFRGVRRALLGLAGALLGLKWGSMTVTSGFSQYMENNCLAWFQGTAFPAVPANHYFALFTTAPVNGVVAGSVEVSGVSYVRKQIAPSSALWANASGAAPATSANAENIVFAVPGGSWGTVVGWAIFDAASSGNMLAYGAFTGVAVGSGDTVEFLTGNLTLSVS
jgi:hypothetical protein